jgi:AcrR family transcriptional regulator
MVTKSTSDVRRRILETASKLFYTQGYNLTGTNQVIAEAEVAKASLYQHFPSKEDLLVEYLSTTAIATNDALRAVIAKHDSPKDKIIAIFDFLVKFTKQTEFHGCNFLNILSELPIENKRVRSLIKKQKDFIRKLFAEILAPLGKEDLADEVYLLFDGAMITSKVQGTSWPVLTAKKIVDKIV